MMKYPLSDKYHTPELLSKMTGPNPLKLEEELLSKHHIPEGGIVCDLGSGNGLTSVFLAKEYGFQVYAADLLSNPEENRSFFTRMGLTEQQIIPVKADAFSLPFEEEFFDAIISTDSYKSFGRDPSFLDEKLLPFVKPGGYLYIAVPGMKEDLHDDLPDELLLSWSPEQLDNIHDLGYWADVVIQSKGAEIVMISEMQSHDAAWSDWLEQENESAANDRLAIEAGGGKHLNSIKIIMRKKDWFGEGVHFDESIHDIACEYSI